VPNKWASIGLVNIMRNQIPKFIVVATALLLNACVQQQTDEDLIVQSAASTAHSTITAPAGNTSFNATDRLAILNLLHSYGYLFDENRLGEYEKLFSSTARFNNLVPQKTSATLEEFIEFLASRLKAFVANGVQRRHFLGPVRFDHQTPTKASGQVYLQLFSIEQGGPPQLLLTGFYSFSTVKENQQWKIDQWEVAVDSRID